MSKRRAGLTKLGMAMRALNRGETVEASRTLMERLCADLAQEKPARYVRAIPMAGGGYHVSVANLATPRDAP